MREARHRVCSVGDALLGFTVRCEPTGHIELVLAEAHDGLGVTADAEPGAC